jgi:hypothetical protein
MVKKTTSTKEGKDTTKDKGFDLITSGWQDKSKALRQFCRVVKKEMYPLLDALFAVGQFAAFKGDTLLDMLMYNALNAVTSENGTKAFKDEYGKNNPASRTVRYRLEKMKFLEIMNAFQKINGNILHTVKKWGKFKLPVLLSIDITHIHFYGKRRKFVRGMEEDRGTRYGYAYASAVISVAGIRFTIHTVPMTQFTEKTEILEKLIREARKYVKIKIVLVDREFSNSPCIKKLEELNVTYLTPVVKHQKKFLQKLRPPCQDTMDIGPRNDKVSVTVVAVENPQDPEETLYYATNMVIPDELLEEVIELYRKRWTVENAFKSQKLEFLGKTYSINFAIRFFFWVLATLLYNAWILCNLMACMDLGLNPAEQERPLVTAFLFGINMKIVFISPLFDGDECEELLRLAIALVSQYILRNQLEEKITPSYVMDN